MRIHCHICREYKLDFIAFAPIQAINQHKNGMMHTRNMGDAAK